MTLRPSAKPTQAKPRLITEPPFIEAPARPPGSCPRTTAAHHGAALHRGLNGVKVGYVEVHIPRLITEPPFIEAR